MKKLFSILFIFVYLSVLIKPLVPILDYIINYNYIKTVLCINKDKPEMHCNGQCHLKQMVKKEVQEENSQDSKIPKIEVYKFQFNLNPQKHFFKMTDGVRLKKYFYKNTLIPKEIIFRIFRPPTFA
ncbi:MAG: hypothetical protein L3J45_00635 [Flavobacteriaceae bacterium]|nr:hypothetical protein [Flavobacteriaceae bacterium]